MLKNFFGPLITLSLLTVVACNGGGGGGGSTPKGNGGGGGNSSVVPSSAHLPASVGNIEGVLLDSAVVGLHYTTGGVQATTGTWGAFFCKAGDVVRFELGQIKIAEVPCLPVITPIELATNGRIRASGVTFSGSTANELSAAENSKLQRIASLLQTLDLDGNLSNGITVEGPAISAMGQILDENDTTLDEALSDGAIDDGWEGALHSFRDLMNVSGGSYQVHADVGQVISHFKDTLASNPACSISDVANSASVAGHITHCVALSCSAGYSVLNGACVQPQQPVLGCMDNTASNYNASATQDDGSCIAASSHYTCLEGRTVMDNAYNEDTSINSTNGTVIGGRSTLMTRTLVVINDGSTSVHVYRPTVAIDQSDWLAADFKKFTATYSLDSNIGGDGLMISNIGYANDSTTDIYFPQVSSLTAGVDIEATSNSTGVSGINLVWIVSRDCELPQSVLPLTNP